MLDALLQVFAYSIVVVPVAVLAIGTALFFYKPTHRLTIGIVLTLLGGFGVAVYSIPFHNSLTKGQGIWGFGALLIVEIMTVVMGIISLTHTKPKQEKS